MTAKVLVWHLVVFSSTVTLGLATLTCDTYKPKKGLDAICTCVSPNNIEWKAGSSSLTSCTTTGICSPLQAGYIFEVENSNTDIEYKLTVQSYAYSSCAKYTCRNLATSTDEEITTSISDFDASSVTFLEPGANTDGQITVTTGCVFPPGDVTVTWYKIKDNKEEDFTKERPSSVDSSERSSCTDTCNTDESKKVTSGFTHTQYKGSNYDEVQYKAVVTHSSYTDAADKFIWTSAKYRLEKGCPKHCKDRVIASIVFCICGIILLAVVIIGIVKNGLRWTVILVVGIISIVLFIISLALSWSVLADDRCKDCKVWLTIAKVCVGISCGGAVADIVILILVRCGVINVPGGNAYKAKEAKHPDENDRMAETSN